MVDIPESGDLELTEANLIVSGGVPLSGEVRVSGAKNSALKLMAAALMCDGPSRIRNVPDILDVSTMAELLELIGAHVERRDHELVITPGTSLSDEAPYEVVNKMRASVIVLGPLVARLGRARVAMPGGCNIGSRKVDLHLAGLERFGVRIEVRHGVITAYAPDGGLRGAHVILDFPSVGATENLLMAAVVARGRTLIENAAREPEIQDLAACLRGMGASIQGDGTTEIVIEGVERLSGADHKVIGDRIECGSYLVAGAVTGGDVVVSGVDSEHLEMVLSKLTQAGVSVRTDGERIEVLGGRRPHGLDIATLPFPGFPTDMQPQFMALLSTSDGVSTITENVFENRFILADELGRMGADIRIEGHHAVVKGVSRLSGAPVHAPDLRAGAALVCAALAADGDTVISGVGHIDRGYEGLENKLRALGARIERWPRRRQERA
jgi:UDP-N-acetylglucosamine 1-carboxyvinyltransferase